MFAFLNKNRTQRQHQQLLGWLKKATRITDPLKLTDLLLSAWSFADKAKVLFSLPLDAINNKTGMRLLESQLEELGHIQLAQVVRWCSFCNEPKKTRDHGLEWAEYVVKSDIMMRWIVQREIYLQEETRAMQKSLALQEVADEKTKTRLEEYEAELKRLNDVYWEMSNCVYMLEADIPDGVLKRAFESCRADPEWYLCQWLRQDCARRGGCCGRGCGCCEKARTANRQWNRGHCTGMCGCCIRTQGRKDINAAQCELEELSSFRIAYEMTQYSARVNRAYIWGLSFMDELDLL